MLVIKKDLNHIDETKLNKYESILFLECLKEEKSRHDQAKKYAVWMAYLHHDNKVISKFHTLQATNHLIDIDMIVSTMNYLIKKWGFDKL